MRDRKCEVIEAFEPLEDRRKQSITKTIINDDIQACMNEYRLLRDTRNRCKTRMIVLRNKIVEHFKNCGKRTEEGIILGEDVDMVLQYNQQKSVVIDSVKDHFSVRGKLRKMPAKGIIKVTGDHAVIVGFLQYFNEMSRESGYDETIEMDVMNVPDVDKIMKLKLMTYKDLDGCCTKVPKGDGYKLIVRKGDKNAVSEEEENA